MLLSIYLGQDINRMLLSDNQKEVEDLKKAIWYIKDRIKQLGGDVEDA